LAGPEYLNFPHCDKNHQTFRFIKIGHITEKKIMKKNVPQARFLDGNIAPQAKLMKQIAQQARFL